MPEKEKPIIKTVKFNHKDPLDMDLVRRIEESGIKFNKLVKYLLFAYFNSGGQFIPVNVSFNSLDQDDDEEEKEIDELSELGIDAEKAKNIVVEADDDDW